MSLPSNAGATLSRLASDAVAEATLNIASDGIAKVTLAVVSPTTMPPGLIYI
jgi:hypothetical protein